MSVIEVEHLLQDIGADAPSGKDLEYDPAFMALVEKARGTPEQQMGDRIEPAVPPNWKEVCKDALALLASTHDLRLAVYLSGALLHTDGYAGLADGLSLLQGFLEMFWDSVHPQLDPEDDDDPTQRMNIISGLCDFESMLHPVLLAPIVESRAMGRFSLRDMHMAIGKLPPPPTGEPPQLAALQAAFSDAPVESLQGTLSAIERSLDALKRTEVFLAERVGVGNTPSLAPLNDLLRDAGHVVRDQLARRGAEVTAEGAVDGAGADEGRTAASEAGTTVAGAVGAIRNRDDVSRTLDLICDYYSRFEPSSPVPLLLRRAKRLVPKDFMEIMMDLAPDALGQVQVIKGQDPDGG